MAWLSLIEEEICKKSWDGLLQNSPLMSLFVSSSAAPGCCRKYVGSCCCCFFFFSVTVPSFLKLLACKLVFLNSRCVWDPPWACSLIFHVIFMAFLKINTSFLTVGKWGSGWGWHIGSRLSAEICRQLQKSWWNSAFKKSIGKGREREKESRTWSLWLN